MWWTSTDLYTHLWQDESVAWSIPWIRHWKKASHYQNILNEIRVILTYWWSHTRNYVWRNCKLTYYLHTGNQPLLMMRQNKHVYVAIWRASVISYQLLIFNKLLTVKLKGAMPFNPFRRVILKGGPAQF